MPRLYRLFSFIALVAVCLFAFLAPMQAADLPTKAPPLMKYDPGPNWTGWYVGAIAGYGWESADVRMVGIPGALKVSQGGPTLGLMAGYDYRFGNIVVGGVIDYSWANISGNANGGLVGVDKKIDQLGSLRARAGFLVTDSILLYGTGGLSVGRLGATGTTILNESIDLSTYSVGWVAGAGAEYAINTKWHAGVEVLYNDLGMSNGTYRGIQVGTPFRATVARAALAYRF